MVDPKEFTEEELENISVDVLCSKCGGRIPIDDTEYYELDQAIEIFINCGCEGD